MAFIQVEVFKWDETFMVSPPINKFVLEEKEGWRELMESRIHDLGPRHEHFTSIRYLKDIPAGFVVG